MPFDVNTFDVEKFDKILSRGLSAGLGTRNGQMCIEAAICTALGAERHSDIPSCVSEVIRSFKIRLNDASWSSPEARAAGMRNLGLAQLGSFNVIDDREFAEILTEKTVTVLLPYLIRSVFPDNLVLLEHAKACELYTTGGNSEPIRLARNAVYNYVSNAGYLPINSSYVHRLFTDIVGSTANTIVRALDSIEDHDWIDVAERTAQAAVKAHSAYPDDDFYLLMSASFALDALKKIKSPGCALL